MTLVKYSVQLTDVSDRAARLLGAIRSEAGSDATDAGIGVNAVGMKALDGNVRTLFVTPLSFNGSLQDRARNLQAGAPKFALGVGDPRDAVAHGGAYYAVAVLAQVVAAVNQFNVWRIRNPAASGVTVYVTYLAVHSLEARRFVITAPNQADANRTNVSGVLKKRIAAANASATFTNDNNVAANLTVGIHGELLVANTVREYREVITIAAGASLDIQVGDTGDTAAEAGTINAEWYEE